jgi:UrcA family protein
LLAALSATLLAAILSTLAIIPAHADSSSASASLAVSLSDLNLSRTADVAKAYRRLHIAAEQVCGSATVTGSRLPSRDWRKCIDATVEGAVRQLDRPALTAYHEARTGGAAGNRTTAVNVRP